MIVCVAAGTRAVGTSISCHCPQLQLSKVNTDVPAIIGTGSATHGPSVWYCVRCG